MKNKHMKENIVKYIISEYNKSQDGVISICKNDIELLNISEDEMINIINTLHTEKLIKRNFMSPHKNLSAPCKITVLDSCLKYFDNKKQIKIKNRREWISTYVPNILSIIAIIISIIAIIVSFVSIDMSIQAKYIIE